MREREDIVTRIAPWRVLKGVNARLRRAMDARERAYGSIRATCLPYVGHELR
jgi:hypothetical protein